MYAKGQEIPQDYKQAYAWYCVVVADGVEGAETPRDSVAAKLTPEQLEKAQALAKQYITQYASAKKYPHKNTDKL